jgi:hypothetical protein
VAELIKLGEKRNKAGALGHATVQQARHHTQLHSKQCASYIVSHYGRGGVRRSPTRWPASGAQQSSWVVTLHRSLPGLHLGEKGRGRGSGAAKQTTIKVQYSRSTQYVSSASPRGARRRFFGGGGIRSDASRQ